MTAPRKTGRKCKACGKPKRECVLPCRLANSAFTEDEKLARWLAHVYERINSEADRLDPDRKNPGGLVACLDNAAKNLGTAVFYLAGKHVSEVR